MAIAIKAENLSKAYQIGEFSTGTISRDIERWLYKLSGKEDPFLKIGETNDRTTRGQSNIVWSLKDVNFEIEQGDAVGIIGRNGAGKSTLLKVLSRVTTPTKGLVKVKGRIASLLEVGTGFHPELTGKENIFLNGAILGMRRHEIKRKFDEIVHFAGIERYIDTPVKRYSSGMYVRLAFAVAAHLESEILIIDEVLAVGDAEFQKKCLAKMGEVSKQEGRTVLFVSHNMGLISQLCDKAIYLKTGMVNHSGITEKVINHYTSDLVNAFEYSGKVKFAGPRGDLMDLFSIRVNDQMVGKHEILVNPDAKAEFNFNYSLKQSFRYRLIFSIFHGGVRIFSLLDTREESFPEDNTNINSRFVIPSHLLRPGIYEIGIGGCIDGDESQWFWNAEVASFTVMDKWDGLDPRKHGLINIEAESERY
jgi:lipopolysaccharide transport system ATP-binding protein